MSDTNQDNQIIVNAASVDILESAISPIIDSTIDSTIFNSLTSPKPLKKQIPNYPPPVPIVLQEKQVVQEVIPEKITTTQIISNTSNITELSSEFPFDLIACIISYILKYSNGFILSANILLSR